MATCYPYIGQNNKLVIDSEVLTYNEQNLSMNPTNVIVCGKDLLAVDDIICKRIVADTSNATASIFYQLTKQHLKLCIIWIIILLLGIKLIQHQHFLKEF